MSTITLVFESKEDCDYFVSIDADHWWYLSSAFMNYRAKRVSPTEIVVGDSYRPVFNDPSNKPSIQKGLKGVVRIKD